MSPEIIMQYQNLIIAIISAVVTVVIAAIVAYKKIIEAMQAKNEIVQELKGVATSLIIKAEENPRELLKSLVNKPDIPNTVDGINKAQIVANALKERHPDLLSKVKIKDAGKLLDYVQTIYNLAKPVIKMLRK